MTKENENPKFWYVTNFSIDLHILYKRNCYTVGVTPEEQLGKCCKNQLIFQY